MNKLSRLDFDQFQIMGAETTHNMCNNDQFLVSGGNPVPAICGVNMGNHSKPFSSSKRFKRSKL